MQEFSHLVITLSKNNLAELKVAENMLLALGGIENAGKEESNFSFEIVAHKNFITIFLTVPKSSKNFVQGQFMSSYPMVEIHEAKDFLDHIGDRTLYGGEMKQADSFVFPLKTYVDYDLGELKKYHDTLIPTLSAFSQIDHPDDIIALQISANSCKQKVAKRGLKGVTIAQGIYWMLEKIFLRSYTRQDRLGFLSYFIWALHFFRKGKEVVAGQRSTRVSSTQHLDSEDSKVSASHEYSMAADKLLKKLFNVNFRILVATKEDRDHAQMMYNSIATSVKCLNDPQLGQLEPTKMHQIRNFEKYKQRKVKRSNVLSSEELASFIHIPNGELEIPKLMWSSFRKIEPPPGITMRDAVFKVGKSSYQNRNTPFGIKSDDILRHIYVIGRTGMGKSTLLENMVYDAMHAGKGLAVIDPHGDLARKSN